MSTTPNHGQLAETYTLIYGFLASREHKKAAKSVKKAAKESQIVSIKPSVVSAQYADKTKSTPLEDIIHEWKEQKARIAELEEFKLHIQEQAELLRKKARRLEEALAEKERQEKERLKEEENRKAKETERVVDKKNTKTNEKEKVDKKKKRAASSSSSSSSEDESSSSGSESSSSLSSSSASSSSSKSSQSSSSSSSKSSKKKSKGAKEVSPAKKSKQKDESDDESSSVSESEQEREVAKTVLDVPITPRDELEANLENAGQRSNSHVNGSSARVSQASKPQFKPSHPSGSSDSDSSTEETQVTKRRRVENGSLPTAVATIEAEDSGSQEKGGESNKGNAKKGKSNGKADRRGGVPFQRIKLDKIEFADPRLKDNTFAARGVVGNDYGAKASQDLIVTRGSGFRKEKNKKKRGSYRGGEITMQSHSIKFD